MKRPVSPWPAIIVTVVVMMGLVSLVLYQGIQSRRKTVTPVSPAKSYNRELVLNQSLFYDDKTIRVHWPDRRKTLTGKEGDTFPSRPVISPNGFKLAYISPYEFELIGDVFVYDAMTNQQKNLSIPEQLPNQHSPKKLYWFNDHILLMIAGFGYGTVSPGGEIYAYDLDTRRFFPIIKNPTGRHQFVEIQLLDKSVILKQIHFDRDFLEYTTGHVTWSRDSIQNLLTRMENGTRPQ